MKVSSDVSKTCSDYTALAVGPILHQTANSDASAGEGRVGDTVPPWLSIVGVGVAGTSTRGKNVGDVAVVYQ